MRAPESATRLSGGGPLQAAAGTTDLLVGPGALRVVDALFTGVRESDTTHFTLLGAFASRAVLKAALTATDRLGFVDHELGDVWRVWQSSARAASATFAA